MTEIVILSGKGGTGKTTVLAGFAALAGKSVIVDCDVDAPNLSILLSPKLVEKGSFSASKKARIDHSLCDGCDSCSEQCRFDAISRIDTSAGAKSVIDQFRCEGCGLCVHICPNSAIELNDHVCGEWFISETKFGPLVHALLEPGDENSGKLVAKIKNIAKQLSSELKLDSILVDGPPGIGCPAISSLANADIVVLVAEPSKSSCGDLLRIINLVKSFHIEPHIILNRYDLSDVISDEMEKRLRKMGIPILGRIPFDEDVYRSLSEGKSIVEYGNSPSSIVLRDIWKHLNEIESGKIA
ncbi:MAG TPA: (4Fe-4S)-binding protein [Euryarchaeota archaeon]|nr:(4Fe-4S)-binding protein [Euryarchaeota archaeon]